MIPLYSNPLQLKRAPELLASRVLCCMRGYMNFGRTPPSSSLGFFSLRLAVSVLAAITTAICPSSAPVARDCLVVCVCLVACCTASAAHTISQPLPLSFAATRAITVAALLSLSHSLTLLLLQSLRWIFLKTEVVTLATCFRNFCILHASVAGCYLLRCCEPAVSCYLNLASRYLCVACSRSP